MSKIRRIDFSPDEWLAGTRELTLEERGAYWDVCALIYSRGGPIADDDVQIARALTCHVRTWRKVRARLLELRKLRLVDGYLTNVRSERALGEARRRIDQAHDAAEESARKRRERAERDANDGPTAGESSPKDKRNDGQNRDETANINDLGRAAAPRRARANYQPSTTNQQEEDSHSQGRARPLPVGWQPSEALLARARKERSDIQPARMKLEITGFIARKRSDNRHSFNWDEEFIAWIIKTKITTNPEPSPHGTQRTNHDRPRRRTGAENAAAFAAAFSVPRDRGPADDDGGA